MPECYDVVLSSPFHSYDFFTHKISEFCGQMGLTFFVVNDEWIHPFLEKVQSGNIKVRVLFDLTANQHVVANSYTRLAREVKQRGGRVIDDPDRTSIMAHKGEFHGMLLEHNLPVPETVLVRRSGLEDFKLTDEIKHRVGVPFVVKPAWGDAGVGVIVDGCSVDDLYQSAEQAPISDCFLIQQKLSPQQITESRVGWFRNFYICGEVIPCWWDPVKQIYELVTPTQQRQYGLAPVKKIMKGIGKVSKMKKFTSEICLHQDGQFYAVDYINADPHMHPKSFYPDGVPDEIVRHSAWLLFCEALRIARRGKNFFDEDLAESDNDWLEQRRLEQRVARL